MDAQNASSMTSATSSAGGAPTDTGAALPWYVVLGSSLAVLVVQITVLTLPICLLKRRGQRRWHHALLSLCNCFAAGVFLSACVLSLIPHAQMQEKKWQRWVE